MRAAVTLVLFFSTIGIGLVTVWRMVSVGDFTMVMIGALLTTLCGIGLAWMIGDSPLDSGEEDY